MILRGPLPDVDIPVISLYQLAFGGLTDAQAAEIGISHPETGQALSWGELRDHVERVAAWLSAHGVGIGDAVALALPTCPEFATAFHGACRSGGAAAPMNVQYSANEFAHHMGASRAKYAITTAKLAPAVLQAAQKLGWPAGHVIVTGDEAPPAGAISYSELTSSTDPLPPENVADPKTHVAVVPLSSGIGGLQKPVMLSHYNLVADLHQLLPVMESVIGTGQQQRLVAFLPLSHVYGLTCLLNLSLSQRFPMVTMSQFDPAAYLTNCATHKATILHVVPPVAAMLAYQPEVDFFDLSAAKVAICGAAPLSQAVGDAFAKRLGVEVLQGYGMTELSPVSHVMVPGMPDVSCETIGPAVPNLEFRVVDVATGQDVEVPAVGESEPGDLWVRGPNVMLGYLGMPEETAKIIDPDGFLHTGDLVRVDHRGVVRIVGRCKELIKNKGFQVAPAELEAVLREHPAVADAGVYGVPMNDGTGDESPYALVVLKPGMTATPIDMIKHVSPRVAKYKFLRSVKFVPAIPRGADGEILRDKLPTLVP